MVAAVDFRACSSSEKLGGACLVGWARLYKDVASNDEIVRFDNIFSGERDRAISRL